MTRTFSIVINPAPTIGNLTATRWTAGTPGFPGVLSIAGGTGPYTLASVTGLPTGVTANLHGASIAFAGTPPLQVAATFANGSVTVRDAAGAMVTRTFSITINPAPTIGSLSVTQWTVGRIGFNGVMKVAGGAGALTIAGSAGLPTGLSIILTGNTISFTGTPSVAKLFAGSVTLRDTIGATVTRIFSISINATPTLANLTTTQWTAGKAGFTGVMMIGAGTGPFTITSSATGLPTGLTAALSGNAIHFIGTPSVAQSLLPAAGSITVRDATGATASRTFSITINPPVLITTANFAPSAVGLIYTAPVSVTGGTGPATFTLTAGSLPPGMKLSSSGIIFGATRGVGSFTFTITATDAIGATFSKQYTLSISRHA